MPDSIQNDMVALNSQINCKLVVQGVERDGRMGSLHLENVARLPCIARENNQCTPSIQLTFTLAFLARTPAQQIRLRAIDHFVTDDNHHCENEDPAERAGSRKQ